MVEEFTTMRVTKKTLKRLRKNRSSDTQSDNNILISIIEELETLREWREIIRRDKVAK